MNTDIKAYDLFWELYQKNEDFKKIVDDNTKTGKIRFFDEREWNKIRKQNFITPSPLMQEFIDMFIGGYNIGNCVGASRQLSYSYNDVDIVAGILPLLKGTRNAEQEGGHCWLETPRHIIDTTLMLVIDKSLKKELGYIEERRLTSFQLANNPHYQARKEFVNDTTIKKSHKK